MITRLEIAGYRSIRALELDVRPLELIVGPNGAGKTNLYRAIQLLQHAATGSLFLALNEPRTAERSRVLVTTHSDKLASAVRALGGPDPVRLTKIAGETQLADEEALETADRIRARLRKRRARDE